MRSWMRRGVMSRCFRAVGGGLVLMLALGSAACDDKKVDADADSSEEEASDKDDKKKADKASDKDSDGAKPAADKEEAKPTGITVDIKDFQLFSPYSDKRSLLSSNKDDAYSTRKKSHYHGVGVVIEATNNTGKMLRSAWFEGELRFVAAGQTVRCAFEVDRVGGGYWTPKTTYLSYAPQLDNKPGRKKPDWKNESESLDESPWRPGERIRMIGRQDYCAAAALSDLPIEKIEGELVVKALPRFVNRFENEFTSADYELTLVGDAVRIRNKQSGRLVSVPVHDDKDSKRDTHVVEMQAAGLDAATAQKLSSVRLNRAIDTWGSGALVESASVPLSLPPAALRLQMVKLGEGMVHASGNVLIFAQDGKIQRVDMSRRGLNMLGLERQDIPGSAAEVTFSSDELSGKVSDVTLAHFADDTSLSKGDRSVSVTWELNLDGSSIDGRLRASVDAAEQAYKDAQAAVDAAGEDDKAAAKTKATAAKTKLAAAKTKYKTASGRERGRLAKLFPCKDVVLVTTRGKRKPSNGKEAADSCKALKSEDKVTVSMRYTLDRYELPVALAYKLGKTLEFSPVASTTLIAADAR